MKKNNLVFFTFLVTFNLLLSFSCNSSGGFAEREKRLEDTIMLDVPESFKNESFRKNKRNFETTLGLQNIENGVQGTEIRILRDYPFSDTSYLIILSQTENNWSGKLYRIKYNYADGELTGTDKTIFNITPKSGWNNFIKKITDLQLFNLPDYTKISGYSVGSTDPNEVIIETATRQNYRYYQYLNPHAFLDAVPQAINIVKMLKLLDEEFNIKMEKFG